MSASTDEMVAELLDLEQEMRDARMTVGAREEHVQRRMGITLAHYTMRLHRAIETDAAARYAPMLVGTLHEERVRRDTSGQRARVLRTTGEDAR